jgi:hypothetical protein
MSQPVETPKVGPRVNVAKKGEAPVVNKTEPQVLQPFKWDNVSDKNFDFRVNVEEVTPAPAEVELPKA